MQPHAPWFTSLRGIATAASTSCPAFGRLVPGDFDRWRDGEPLLVAQGAPAASPGGHPPRSLRCSELLERLDETGLYDRALVIVTADHGISFRPGGWKRHADRGERRGHRGRAALRQVPGPEARAARTGVPPMTIDVLPTVADVSGSGSPWQVEGRSLRAAPCVREVRVGARGARPSWLDRDDVAADVLRVARRNAALFGDGKDSLYRLGPRRELLGRAGGEPARGRRPANADVELVRASELAECAQVVRIRSRAHRRPLDWSEARPQGASRDRRQRTSRRGDDVVRVERPTRYFSSLVDETLFVDGREHASRCSRFAVAGGGTRLFVLGGTGSPCAVPVVAAVRDEP